MTRTWLLAVALTASLGAQAPATATAVVAGTIVVDDASGQPARGAIVTLNDVGGAIRRTTVSDDRGRFLFDGLPAGRFLVSASKPTFLTMNYGAVRPGRPGSAIVVSSGARADVMLKLPKGAVLTGRIADMTGTQVWGAPVYALQYRWQNGQRTLVRAGQNPEATTDDQGVYRIYGLPPGEYVVSMTPGFGSGIGGSAREITDADVRRAQSLTSASSLPIESTGRTVGFAAVYYPGTTDVSAAQTVTLAAGEEKSGVDMRFVLVPIATVSGTIAAPPGTAFSSVLISMVPSGPSAPTQGIGIGSSINGFASSRPAAGGKYTITGVAPGRYALTARLTAPAGRGTPASTSMWATAEIVVDGRDVDASMTLKPAKTVSGHVIFDGASPAPDLSRVRIAFNVAEVASGGASIASTPGQAHADGTFSVTGVTPARYRLAVTGAPAPWALTSATSAGRDVLDGLLDVDAESTFDDLTLTFTDHPAMLSGSVTDASGRPAPEYFVIVFPADKSQWTWQSRRIQAVRPGTNGVYAIANLPEGSYRIAAVSDVENNEWFDPSFLAMIAPASMAFSLTAGEQKSVNLKLAR